MRTVPTQHDIATLRMLSGALLNARRHAALTQQELADAAGVSKSWIVRMENSKSPNIEAGKIFLVIRALDLTLDLRTETDPISAQLAKGSR